VTKEEFIQLAADEILEAVNLADSIQDLPGSEDRARRIADLLPAQAFSIDAPPPADPVVEAVRADLLSRSQVGIAKYGVTLARTDLTLRDWLQHAYEETLDQANYLKRAILEIDAQAGAAASEEVA
jgi:hypothetical protein